MAESPDDVPEIPLVRIQPRYPPRALQRRVAGEVCYAFGVTPYTEDGAGRPRDVCVLRSAPGGIFEQAGFDALRRWRYKPLAAEYRLSVCLNWSVQ